MKTEIPLLQNVRIASPCPASWEAMTPVDADRVRFCDWCQKRVYNLSAMSQAEAEGVLRTHEDHLCVRYYQRQDGTILTGDCPVGLRAARTLLLKTAGVSVWLFLLFCAALVGYRAVDRASPVAPKPMVGDIIQGRASIEERAFSQPPPEPNLRMGEVARWLLPSSQPTLGKIANILRPSEQKKHE